MFIVLTLFLILFFQPVIFTMEETESKTEIVTPRSKQKILDHFEGNVFNIKEIYEDIAFLTHHALDGNKKALMLLIDYTESTKAVFDFLAYGVQNDAIFNAIPWDKLPLDFFRKNNPEKPQEYYYWGMFYANTILQRLNEHKDVLHDLKKVSFNYVSQSAAMEFPKAMYWLGHLYYRGSGTEKNKNRAFFWKNKAAQAHYIPALFDVSLMYLKGIGVPENPDMGLSLMQEAAIKNSSTANHYLGIVHERDARYLNREKALEYYKKAAKTGCLDAKNSLGILYINSSNKDIIQGLQYINKAAQKGSAHANLSLGLIYCKGDPIKQNIPKGLQLIKKAASLNHPLAFYELGKMRLKGIFTKKNVLKGVKLLQKSSHPLANYELSALYIYGEEKEIPQNLNLGISLLQQAAKAGLPSAQFSLGKLYIEGEYIQENKKRGLSLISAAARKGFAPAIKYRRNLY